MTPLINLFQISDLHFGKIEHGTGNADLSDPNALPQFNALSIGSVPPPFPASLFSGFYGHSGEALIALADAYYLLGGSLLVTGDATAIGLDEQFINARAFLDGTLDTRSAAGTVGLLDPTAWVNRTIPGNHDHWPGHYHFCGPAAAINTHFSSLPSLPFQPFQVHLGTHFLSIAGIDSTSEIGSGLVERMRARGQFVAQLKHLKNAWKAARLPNETRVLLLHHSPMLVNPLCMSIHSRSKRELFKTTAELEISVLLTGHEHTPAYQAFVEQTAKGKWTVHELRCGTSTQRDRLPTHSQPAGSPRQFVPATNYFLYHVLADDNGKLYWTAQVYERSRQTGFGQPKSGPKVLFSGHIN